MSIRTYRKRVFFPAALYLACSGIWAGIFSSYGEDGTDTTWEENQAKVVQICNENAKRHQDNPDLFVRPGLIADRKAREVRIYSEATGIGKHDIAEFFLIDRTSGHAYESVAVSFAKPSDIHNALVFIGMKPGRPVNTAKADFWPKGERVLMTFARYNNKAAKPVRAEQLIVYDETDRVMPLGGLVFVGSYRTNYPANSKTQSYAADVIEPQSIASIYNEPSTLLDVPRREPQHDIYKQRLINPEYLFKKGTLLEVVLKPEYEPPRKRVVDVSLHARKTTTQASALAEIEFTLSNADIKQVGNFEHVLKKLRALTESGHDPFVTLHFDPKLSIKTISEICKVLETIDSENGIRIEAPLPEHLYYKAFLPDENMRGRAKRISQPWELRIAAADNAHKITMTQINQKWPDDGIWPVVTTEDIPVASPEAFKKELSARGPGLSVIFVFADPLITYEQVLAYIAPVHKAYPIVYVYQGAPIADQNETTDQSIKTE
ncbi:MAG: hypothetical protein JXN60_06975 [Lentisphaerae bacterium]|nr:hypothetical protein [Lentisphaerota bacterium]